MVDMDGENTRKWINIDQIDRIGHQQNISYPSQQAGQGAQAAAWWSTGWCSTHPQIDFNFGFFSSNCRDQNPPRRHHYIMSSCCLPKMWNFSKVSIHQCFPFTSISFIFQYIVKTLDLQPHLVWTFCHWILPVNFLDLNMSSEKLWVHSSILPPTQIQQCQSPRSIQGAVVRFPNCHEYPEATHW